MKVTVSLAVIHSGDMLLCVGGRGTGQTAVCEGRSESVPAVAMTCLCQTLEDSVQ